MMKRKANHQYLPIVLFNLDRNIGGHVL